MLNVWTICYGNVYVYTECRLYLKLNIWMNSCFVQYKFLNNINISKIQHDKVTLKILLKNTKVDNQ